MKSTPLLAAVVLITAASTARAEAPGSYDSQWGTDSYSTPSNWISFGAAAGLATLAVREEIATTSTVTGTAIDVGATLHLGHMISIPVELRLRTGSVDATYLRSQWGNYDSTATMVGSGVRFALFGNEVFEVGGTARFGVAFLGSDAALRDTRFNWDASGPYVGGGLDLAVFPFRGLRSLELGLGFEADRAFTSSAPGERYHWETDSDDRSDLFTALLFRAAWHL